MTVPDVDRPGPGGGAFTDGVPDADEDHPCGRMTRMQTSPAPAVEMLWENEDPHAIISSRFGFDDAAQAGTWVSITVQRHWGLEIRACTRIVISDSNALAWLDAPSGPLVLKWSVARERFPRLDQLAQVVSWLGTRGLPVSTPLPAQGGRPRIEVDGASLELQHRIDGAILDVGDRAQVHTAGATLAHLHRALANTPAGLLPTALSGPDEPLSGRVRGFLEGDRSHVPADSLQALTDAVGADLDEELPTQLLHGDFRGTNILLTGLRVEAVLDFDEARIDHRIDELARSAVLLGTQFRTWDPVSVGVRSDLLAGYESVSPLSPTEARWWPVLVLWYSLAMIPPDADGTSAWSRAARDQLSSPPWSP